MKSLTLKEISDAIGGECTEDAIVKDVCTDSRLADKGFLYVAVKGKKSDGHNFTASALQNGAAGAMISRDVDCQGKFIRVADTGKALSEFAHWFRCTFDIPVVGVTGSVGKTTIKEMTRAVLSEKYNTIKTEDSFFDSIGLLKFEEDTQAAVVEMGMSNGGEISVLSQTTEPTIAIISNIGVSHMESLGSRENILKAKLEILDGLREGCPVILNGDDPYLMGAAISDRPVFYYGIDNRSCDYRAENISQDGNETSFTVVYDGNKKQNIVIPTIGIHNVYNAIAAFGTGLQSGVTPEQAANGLRKYVPPETGQRVKNVKGIKFIEDCCNANPDSQRAALKMLSSIEAKRKIAVLGDMLELGKISEDAHRDAGLLASKNKIDVLMTYGENSLATADNALKCGVPVVKAFLDKKELADALFEELKQGDAVLFKASRGMALNDVINDLYSRIK